MFNHNRGLWGYTGTAADGEPLTIQATGIGGPSAAIVLEELIALGARRARSASARPAALDAGARARRAARRRARRSAPTGRAAALGARRARSTADPALLAALRAAAPASAAPARSSPATSSTRTARRALRARGARAGARAVEMEAAALFALGALRGVAVGCRVAISDVLGGRASGSTPEALPSGPRGRAPGRRRAGAPSGLASARGLDAQALLAAARPRAAVCAAGRGEARRAGAASPRAAASIASRRAATAAGEPLSASSRRESVSSIASSRCETERTRRVSRSICAAEGRLRNSIATSCACAALPRASSAAASAELTHGFSSRSWAIRPIASSPRAPKRSRRPSACCRVATPASSLSLTPRRRTPRRAPATERGVPSGAAEARCALLDEGARCPRARRPIANTRANAACSAASAGVEVLAAGQALDLARPRAAPARRAGAPTPARRRAARDRGRRG